jgi:hypothetical protein
MRCVIKEWSSRMGPNHDDGGDISSPELTKAIEAGWWLMRQWTIRGGEALLILELKRRAPDYDKAGSHPLWLSYKRTYHAGEIDMLTQEIVRGHAAELAQRAMAEYPPGDGTV